MGLPEIADFARNFAVMVKVQGPDPKGLKMRKHAFHHHHSGNTTLSASGMLLPDSLTPNSAPGYTYAITVASVVDPFLSLQHRETIISQAPPKFIPGVHIDVMVEGKIMVESDSKGLKKTEAHWLPAQLEALVDVSEASLALQMLIDASSSSLEHGWDVGWSLASYGNGGQPRSYMNSIKSQVGHDTSFSKDAQSLLPMGETIHQNVMGKYTTRVAFLRVSSICTKDLPNIVTASSSKQGDILLTTGSPFGVLSPGHFFNSVSVGSIGNCYPSSSSTTSLLMADIRCLPGMEGGPVFTENAHLIGILTRPLKQKSSGAEVQLVIPWEGIATACTDLPRKGYQMMVGVKKDTRYAISNSSGFDATLNIGCRSHVSSCPSPSIIKKAMTSICLITADDGVWASGVLLNKKGLILTNAHLLEPWRFGRTSVNYGRNENNSFENVSPVDGVVDLHKSDGLIPHIPKIGYSSVVDGKYNYGSSYSGHRRIRVRLDHVDPWVWCDASVVYISKGPLDIALLQLDHVPDQLHPIVTDPACPSPGLKAYVIGHGLFGPQSDIFPSVCPGVVAKVVEAKMPQSYQSNFQQISSGCIPAMIETTAAVHPGGSGGAIVNSYGHMIGLVTSNARHGGGTVIPHLNFSIPCAVLEPIFCFSKDMQDFSLLQNLDKPNELLSSVWALMPPPLSPKPGPSLPGLPKFIVEDSNREGKGSRFAKFIADKHEAFKKATQVGKVERLSSEFISSKL